MYTFFIMYYVLIGGQGTAVCLQKDATGKDVEVARLTQGHYFGEVGKPTPTQSK